MEIPDLQADAARPRGKGRRARWPWLLVGLMGVQIVWGAFMAWFYAMLSHPVGIHFYGVPIPLAVAHQVVGLLCRARTRHAAMERRYGAERTRRQTKRDVPTVPSLFASSE